MTTNRDHNFTTAAMANAGTQAPAHSTTHNSSLARYCTCCKPAMATVLAWARMYHARMLLVKYRGQSRANRTRCDPEVRVSGWPRARSSLRWRLVVVTLPGVNALPHGTQRFQVRWGAN